MSNIYVILTPLDNYLFRTPGIIASIEINQFSWNLFDFGTNQRFNHTNITIIISYIKGLLRNDDKNRRVNDFTREMSGRQDHLDQILVIMDTYFLISLLSLETIGLIIQQIRHKPNIEKIVKEQDTQILIVI